MLMGIKRRSILVSISNPLVIFFLFVKWHINDSLALIYSVIQRVRSNLFFMTTYSMENIEYLKTNNLLLNSSIFF